MNYEHMNLKIEPELISDIYHQIGTVEPVSIVQKNLERKLIEKGYMMGYTAATNFHIKNYDEKERIKSQIKVLESKLSLLEELENTKSPEEKAFYRIYGYYPTEDVSWNVDKKSWEFFHNGYHSALEDK